MLLLIFRCVHSAVTPGESRFRPHCSGALVMGINAKLRRDINSPDFSTIRLGLFGHVARLRRDVPANRSLRICTKSRDGERPSQE